VLLVPLASYVTSGVLTWAIPLGVVLLVGLYWWFVIHRNRDELE
jgi:cytochrome c-type biogenesis protein CcmH/NrfF